MMKRKLCAFVWIHVGFYSLFPFSGLLLCFASISYFDFDFRKKKKKINKITFLSLFSLCLLVRSKYLVYNFIGAVSLKIKLFFSPNADSGASCRCPLLLSLPLRMFSVATLFLPGSVCFTTLQYTKYMYFNMYFNMYIFFSCCCCVLFALSLFGYLCYCRCYCCSFFALLFCFVVCYFLIRCCLL